MNPERFTQLFYPTNSLKIKEVWMFYIKELKHKLLYCYIPKNSCTMFKSLFYGMINNILPKVDWNVHSKIANDRWKYKPTAEFVTNKLLNDERWKSLVVLRDPLERLVSGFVNKCIGSEGLCEGSKTADFRVFVDRVLHKMNTGKLFHINAHYRPQHTFCGLDKYFKYFDYVIYYQRANVANDTFKFMESVGIDNYYYKWGIYHNQTMFVTKTDHYSKINQTSLKDKIVFYSKYYDKELAMKVISAFHIDYEILKFPYPEWLNAINIINGST